VALARLLPRRNIQEMNLHLADIATQATPGYIAALLMDQAGWHMASIVHNTNCGRSCCIPPRLIIFLRQRR